MRLIDADELRKKFRYAEADTENEKAMCAAVRRIIKEQPTAYDVEKVIDELKKNEMKLANSKMHWEEPLNPKWIEKVIRFSKAVAIVRRGGKDLRRCK